MPRDDSFPVKVDSVLVLREYKNEVDRASGNWFHRTETSSEEAADKVLDSLKGRLNPNHVMEVDEDGRGSRRRAVKQDSDIEVVKIGRRPVGGGGRK